MTLQFYGRVYRIEITFSLWWQYLTQQPVTWYIEDHRKVMTRLGWLCFDIIPVGYAKAREKSG